jgi:uncharacterized membrane protein YgaE (UPF0421/DUF939 family)
MNVIPLLRASSASTAERIRRRHAALPVIVQSRTRRLWSSTVPILQCSLAAGLAWWLAHDILDHGSPFFAPIAAIISLGLSFNQRLRRSLELVGGVTVGIGVGDLLIGAIGTGPWQLGAVVALAMTVAVLADRGPLVPMQAASSAVLVATLLPPGSHGAYDRMFDALIGGVVGVLVAALLPNHPALRPRRDAAKVLDTMRRVTRALGKGLSDGDRVQLDWALETARTTQPALDQFRADLGGGMEIARVSPVFWSARARMERLKAIAEPLDNSIRNVRVLARRAVASYQDGERVQPKLIAEIAALSRSFEILRDTVLAEPGQHPDQDDAAVLIAKAAARAVPDIVGDGTLNEMVMYGQLRSTLVDLLQVAGLRRREAIATLR